MRRGGGRDARRGSARRVGGRPARRSARRGSARRARRDAAPARRRGADSARRPLRPGEDAVASFASRRARRLGGAVERLAAGARPFALARGRGRRRAAARGRRCAGAAEALAQVERAVRHELRPGDVLGREDDGRLWVVAADLGATGARALAERLADAVAAVPPLRGAPSSVSIGVAASPAGGADRDELTARADESLYAARAAGVPIA